MKRLNKAEHCSVTIPRSSRAGFPSSPLFCDCLFSCCKQPFSIKNPLLCCNQQPHTERNRTQIVCVCVLQTCTCLFSATPVDRGDCLLLSASFLFLKWANMPKPKPTLTSRHLKECLFHTSDWSRTWSQKEGPQKVHTSAHTAKFSTFSWR